MPRESIARSSGRFSVASVARPPSPLNPISAPPAEAIPAAGLPATVVMIPVTASTRLTRKSPPLQQYTGVQSAGWEVETFATLAAVAELDRLREDAWTRALARQTSALEFHMFDRRMELDTLAATTGIWKWRIRRHFDVQRFARLPQRVLERYADAMGITVERLKSVPPAVSGES